MGRKRSLEDLRREQKEYGPKTKKSKPMRKRGFDEETLSEATFYIQNGLRYVKPYHFTFSAYAKGRWIGSKIYDMFCREFQAETPQFYERAFKAGKVTVNGEIAAMDRVVKNNDIICHTVHRHEPPVTAQPLKIIHEGDDIVVINKPSSIPVHPCGRYRHNTVVFLLGKEHNLFNLRTIHRIDRLTSGLLIFAKSLARAQSLEAQIRGRELDKEYVCRVGGEFPSGTVECNEPILIVSMKLGICKVDPQGKDCSTTFMRLSYNGRTSVVKCIPKTGRMHQIRVHLQWLGYPIVNDPLYNNLAWGPCKGKQGQEIGCVDEVITRIVKSSYSSDIFDDLPSADAAISEAQLSTNEGGCVLAGVPTSVEDEGQGVKEEGGGRGEMCQGQGVKEEGGGGRGEVCQGQGVKEEGGGRGEVCQGQGVKEEGGGRGEVCQGQGVKEEGGGGRGEVCQGQGVKEEGGGGRGEGCQGQGVKEEGGRGEVCQGQGVKEEGGGGRGEGCQGQGVKEEGGGGRGEVCQGQGVKEEGGGGRGEGCQGQGVKEEGGRGEVCQGQGVKEEGGGGRGEGCQGQGVKEEGGRGEVCQGQDGLVEEQERRGSTDAVNKEGTQDARDPTNEGDMKDGKILTPRAGCASTQAEGPGDGSGTSQACGENGGTLSGSSPTAVDGEFDPECSFCRQRKPDPTPHQLVMYLHALSYKGPDWEYRTELPAWAAEDWEEEE